MNVKLVFQSGGSDTEEPFELERRMALPDRMPCIGEAIALTGPSVGLVTWVLWHLGSGLSEVHLKPHPGYEATISRQDLLKAGWHAE